MTILPEKIDHTHLFLFGFLYYIISPIIILKTTLFAEYPGINNWRLVCNLSPNETLAYLLIALLIFLSFNAGSTLAKNINIKTSTIPKNIGKTSSWIITTIALILTLYFIHEGRNYAFKGYSIEYNSDVMGPIATTNLLCFIIHFNYKTNIICKRIVFLLLIINSVFLLGMGGRMYVLLPFIGYYIRYYNTQSKSKTTTKLLIPIFTLISATVIGAIRINAELSLIPYLAFAEPIFTSYSSFTFIKNNPIPPIELPINFIASFINVIPTSILTEKREIISTITSNWANFSSPLGALSIVVSTTGDFGFIGSSLFFLIIGIIFQTIKNHSKKNKIPNEVYYTYCTILPFTLFRDPIGITIKIVFLSIITTRALIYLLHLMTRKENPNDTHRHNNI